MLWQIWWVKPMTPDDMIDKLADIRETYADDLPHGVCRELKELEVSISILDTLLQSRTEERDEAILALIEESK